MTADLPIPVQLPRYSLCPSQIPYGDRDDPNPWPILFAFGIAIAELRLFLGYAVVAVSGVALFGGSRIGGLLPSALAVVDARRLVLSAC